MVFLRDDGSVFDVPRDLVWEFFGSGEPHSRAHRHTRPRREHLTANSGIYRWEIDVDGTPTPFAMRWTAFPPLGLAYEVLDGPFAGSRFFLYYTPLGDRTGVTVVGEFTSPSLSDDRLPAAVDRFLSREFEEDSAALRALRSGR